MRAKTTTSGKSSSVIDTRFGLPKNEHDETDYGAELRSLLKNQENVSSLLAQTLLLEAYDTAYNIADYENREVTGFDYVKMYAAEDFTQQTLLYDTIRKFGKRSIAKVFGLSLTEFLELPRDVCEHLFAVALEIATERNNALDDIMDDIEE